MTDSYDRNKRQARMETDMAWSSVETWGWLMVLNAQLHSIVRGEWEREGVGIAGGACRSWRPDDLDRERLAVIHLTYFVTSVNARMAIIEPTIS